MRRSRFVRIIPVLLLAFGVSCASPETDEPAATSTGGSDDANVLSITASEYEFDVSGDPRAGTLTIDVANDGEEWHEIVMAKLQSGKTLEDVREALENAGEDEDPFDAFADEDAGSIDDIAGSQLPGTSYEITGAGVVPGKYMLTCFVPNADGESHWSLGMLGEFTIAEGTTDAVPPADVTFTIDDEGLDGPEELDAGSTSMRVVNDSKGTRELALMRIKDGKTPKDVAESLASADEGPPPVSTAPFDFFAYVFDAEQDRTIEVDLTPGRWVLQAGDPEDQSNPPPDEDPLAVVFTVT